jgi:hypothetical protein
MAEVGRARATGLPGLSRRGDDAKIPRPFNVWPEVPSREGGGGVLAGDDFWGEIDLARSESTR